MAVRLSILAIAMLLCAAALADRAKAQTDAQADSPSPTDSPAPAAPGAGVAPAARALLDAADAAYAAVASAELSGTLRLSVRTDDKTDERSAAFESVFRRPGEFQSTLRGESTVGVVGGDAYLHLDRLNAYRRSPVDVDETGLKRLPPSVMTVVIAQNPSLAMLLSQKPSSVLVGDESAVTRADDIIIDAVGYPAVLIVTADERQTAVFDPVTGLLRRLDVERTESMQSQGGLRVARAVSTVEYTLSRIQIPIDDARLEWSPPPAARDATGRATGIDDTTARAGKPAPDFSLEGLDGKPVRLQDLKGRVTVLDFWATWCPPCRASMPALVAFRKSAPDVAVFAINVAEDRGLVEAMLNENQWDLPVLLDADGSVAAAYSADSLPTTVVIDASGVIRERLIGYDEERGPERLAEAVAKARQGK